MWSDICHGQVAATLARLNTATSADLQGCPMEALQGYSLTMIVFLTYCTEMYGTVFVWLIKETHQD